MQPFAPLGRDLQHRGQKCSYSPGDNPVTDCPTDATWHILWTVQDAGLACDEHMAVARQQFVFVDSHRISPDCAMPGAHWDVARQRFLYPDETAAGSATAQQPATTA